jgi:signal transduction histidine kinase
MTEFDREILAQRSSAMPPSVESATVLVADDNADMREYLVHLLRDRYALEVVADGAAALHAARADRPDLILADIMMPRMDGLELLRALRADPGTATIPVVLLSARAGEEAAVEGLQAGADDYLIKPFSAQELLARVKVHVDMSRAREEIERERDEFLSAVAHDLRTPLTAIKGFTQILQRQLKRHAVLDAERAADPLRLIDHTATRLTQMIAELQDITLIGPGRPLALQLAPIDLTRLVREVVDQQQQSAPSHYIQASLPAGPLGIVGDASRLERVLSNLLANAVKYSPPSTAVDVSLTQEGEGAEGVAVITVADKGIGIPAAELSGIFDRFSRGSNVTSDTTGTGIGLASVRQIVEQHGGTVTVESREAEGSTFSVRLPLLVPDTADRLAE